MRRLFAPMALTLALLALLTAPVAFAQASLPAEISGTSWSLVSLTPAGGSAEDVTGGGITLEFGAENAFSGSGGCNNYRGSYTTSGAGAVDFGPAAATLRACDEPAGSREGVFFQALDAITAYSLDGDRLTLSADDGTELVFVSGAPAAATPPASLPSTGGATEAALWLVLAALILGGAGLALRHRLAR